MIRLRSLLTNDQGLTYIEILGAVILLAFLIPLFIMFVDGVRMVGNSKIRNQAMEAAQQKMEELKDLEYDDANLSDGAHTDEKEIGGRTFYLRWTIEDNPTIDGTQLTGVKQIRIEVAWNEQGHEIDDWDNFPEGTKTTEVVSLRYENM